MDRSNLPFRKNCEGYFVFKNNLIVARDTGKGYIEFPGGGVELNEKPIDAIKRETIEETGAIVKDIKEINVIRFVWDKEWAKTDKQKQRYKKFQGEEMHFFTGKVVGFTNPIGDKSESGWDGKNTMLIKDVIKKIIDYGYSNELKEYREFQIHTLKKFNEMNQ